MRSSLHTIETLSAYAAHSAIDAAQKPNRQWTGNPVFGRRQVGLM